VNALLVQRASARAGGRGTAMDPARPYAAGVREPLTGRPLDWGECLRRGLDEETAARLHRDTLTGRPGGDERWVRELETALARGAAAATSGFHRIRACAPRKSAACPNFQSTNFFTKQKDSV
jgi:hypothetical protein